MSYPDAPAPDPAPTHAFEAQTRGITALVFAILGSPEAVPAPDSMRALAGDLVAGRTQPGLADTLHPLIERFDGGAILQVLFLTDSDGA